MPELPEVEAARRAIEDHCCGKKIVRCVVADDNKVIEGVSPADLHKSIQGKTIVAAHRKGKNMWLQLDSPPFPSFQFGMAGAVYIKGIPTTKYKRAAMSDADDWPSKYSKLFVELDDGLEFSFTDKRRFAKVRLLQEPKSVPPISDLGPDALLELMSPGAFGDLLRKRAIGIKALLLDQGFISGIGNWIADEVLYQAHIHPLRTASSLSIEECNQLHSSIKEVIAKALEVGADSSQFPDNWIYHSREKKPGEAFVEGKRIDFITAGGRTTAFVPELQKLAEVSSGSSRRRVKKDVNSHGEEEVSGVEVHQKTKVVKKATIKHASTSKGRKKSRHNDEDDDDDIDNEDDGEDEAEGVEERQKTKVVKKASIKRGKRASTAKGGKKSRTDNDADDGEDDVDDGVLQKKAKDEVKALVSKRGAVSRTTETAQNPKRIKK